MTIAITGASGHLGHRVVEALKARTAAHSLVALARSAAKAADLGITVREADYDRPETLAAGLEGIDTVLLISSSEVGRRVAQHAAVIDAAKAQGVRQIVYTSLLRADTSPLALAVEHRETERLLRASGIGLTILRNGWYIENYAGAVAGAVATGAVIGSSGAGRIAGAARADYAEAAAVVLTSAGHEGATYELAGDHAFTRADLAAEIARQTGRPIAYHDLPVADFAAALIGAGVPEPFARLVAESEPQIADGALFDDTKTLSRLIGRPTTPLSEVVAAILGAAG